MSSGSDGVAAASTAQSEYARPVDLDDFSQTSSGLFPPTFDEMMTDAGLFMLFLQFCTSQHCAEGLLFVKQATQFAHMRRPRNEIIEEAIRIYWTYVAKGASAEVSLLKPEFCTRLETTMWEPEGLETISSDIFTEGILEVRESLKPVFSNWLGTDEWKTCEFFVNPPPSVEATLRHPLLRNSLMEYAGVVDTKANDGQLAGMGKRQLIVRFCIQVIDLRQRCSDMQRKSPRDSEAFEEYASGVSSIIQQNILILDAYISDNDDTEHDIDYLDRAYHEMIARLTRSSLYKEWLAKGDWHDTDYLPLMRMQSYDRNGFMQPPTLIAALSSPQLLHTMAYFIKRNQERLTAIEFLLEVIKFSRNYKQISPVGTPQTPSLPSGPISGSSNTENGAGEDEKDTDSSRKKNTEKMLADAKKIYSKFMKDEKTGFAGLPAVLKSEVKAMVTGFTAKNKVNRNMFRRCGAYLYAFISRTWFREITGSYIWVDMEYNNDVPAATFISDEFSLSLISDLQIVVPPKIDDIIYNKGLIESFVNSLPGVVSSSVLSFIEAADKFLNNADEWSKIPPPSGSSKVADITEEVEYPITSKFREVLELLSQMILLFPQAKTFYRLSQTILEEKRHNKFSKMLFQYPKNVILSDLLRKHYTSWVSKESNWSTLSWAPVVVCCYEPQSSLFAFASYTSSKACETDRSLFNSCVSPKPVLLARHYQRRPGTSSTSVLPSPPGSITSSPTSSTSSTPVNTTPLVTCGASPPAPTPLQVSGKSHSFQHNCINLGGKSGQLITDVLVSAGSSSSSPSIKTARIMMPTQAGRGDKEKISNARRIARRSMGSINASSIFSQGSNGPSDGSEPLQLFQMGSPTLQQVLESSLFRRFYVDTILQDVLGDMALWRDLDNFFNTYSELSDMELTKRRSEMVSAALTIVDKFSDRITELYKGSGSKETAETLQEYLLIPSSVVTAAFFRELELLLCKPHFSHHVQLWMQTNLS